MKKLENLESILTINIEEYEFLDNLLELNKNSDNLDEIEKLQEKLNKLRKLYENNFYID